MEKERLSKVEERGEGGGSECQEGIGGKRGMKKGGRDVGIGWGLKGYRCESDITVSPFNPPLVFFALALSLSP